MGWIEILVGSGIIGMILGPIIHRRGNLERWLRLAQTILSQLLNQTDSRGDSLAIAIPKTTGEQTQLVQVLTRKLLAAGVPEKYAAGLAAEALRLEQRIPAPVK